ncbi:MAG: hypothetical protein CMLOHMNK_01405 [Steroidobacteraceae bacterium]|nr:hypothetical protein [Steroidobacteraceae bacterium]
MRRRDFILGSAGALAPLLVRAQRPCPPPESAVVGGGSTSTACRPAAGGNYVTDFPLVENPLSEGGRWICGKAVGLDWNNPQTAFGRAFASVRSGASGSRYDDSIAHLNRSLAVFQPNQFAQGTVYRAAGYSPAGSKHEVELLLRFEITAHNARGYEVLWGHDGDFAVVRWNGPLGDYTTLGFEGPGPGAPVDGDVLRAEISGGVIKVYKNDWMVGASSPNTTWAEGQPGVGFWPVDASTPANYGWKHFEAGNL